MTTKELIEYLENYEYSYSSKDYEMIMKVMEYVKTPLDKRTPEKRYRWKLKGAGKAAGNIYFTYDKNNKEWYPTYTKWQSFTKTKFNKLKEELEIEFEFEPIEIEEEKL